MVEGRDFPAVAIAVGLCLPKGDKKCLLALAQRSVIHAAATHAFFALRSVPVLVYLVCPMVLSEGR